MKAWLALAVLTLCACATGAAKCSRLPDGHQYCIADGAWPEFETEQVATITRGDNAMQMIVRIASDKNGVQLAGISPLGQTLIGISLADGAIRTEPFGSAGGRIDGTFLLGLLQLAVWPADELAGRLPLGYTLLERPAGRTLRDSKGGEILSIAWEGRSLPYKRLEFHMRGTGLSIDTLTLTATEE